MQSHKPTPINLDEENENLKVSQEEKTKRQNEEEKKLEVSREEEEENEKGGGLFLEAAQKHVLTEPIDIENPRRQVQILEEELVLEEEQVLVEEYEEDEYKEIDPAEVEKNEVHDFLNQQEIDPAEVERNAVQAFLNQSVNYKTLTRIQQTSENNKKSIYGSFSITQKFYEINPEEKEVITNLANAKTFNELLDITTMRDKIGDMETKHELTFSSYGSQRANASLYLLRLAEEINKHANDKNYSLEPEKPRHIASPSPFQK